jgi:hypothetical protein
MIFCLFAGAGSIVLTGFGVGVDELIATGSIAVNVLVADEIATGVPVLRNDGISGRFVQPEIKPEITSIE